MSIDPVNQAPRGRRDTRGRLNLWPIGRALAVCFAAAVAGLAGLSWLALALLHDPALPHPSTISLQDTVGVLQLVFASVAGAGALVALVVAYRRQKVAEVSAEHDRIRVLNERFTAIATQLGDDQPAVQLAGIHAMAGLADDWPGNRQTCVDVLCAYLRMPYERQPGKNAPAARQLAFRSNREVRHSAIRIITRHLREEAAVSWQGLDLDFTGVQFDGGDFRGAVFSGGTISFTGAVFSGMLDFNYAVFSGATVSFRNAQFADGCNAIFGGVAFSGGDIIFTGAEFSGGEAQFNSCNFSGGLVRFGACFTGGKISFAAAGFYGADVHFSGALFSGSDVSFDEVEFGRGLVSFEHAGFSAGSVSFSQAEFRGSDVSFNDAKFAGTILDFAQAADWSHPPVFNWTGPPPPGLMFPAAATHSTP